MPARTAVATAILVAGLLMGSLADRSDPLTPAVTADGEHVLQADLHVHAFPGDGWMAPWDLLKEARRRRLDVIAVTNHNQTLAARLGRWFCGRGGGPMLLVGDEVTAPGYHLVAAGIERPIDWRLPAARAIDAIHAQGGVAIAAHPKALYWPAYDAAALDRLDGAEVAHPLAVTDSPGRNQLIAFYARAMQRRVHPLSAVGSSDFHVLSALGLCRTYVFARERSVAGVLEALRAGRTVAQDGRGALHGDPARRAFVERLRTDPAQGPRPRTTLEAAAAGAAWIGLLALLLLSDWT